MHAINTMLRCIALIDLDNVFVVVANEHRRIEHCDFHSIYYHYRYYVIQLFDKI